MTLLYWIRQSLPRTRTAAGFLCLFLRRARYLLTLVDRCLKYHVLALHNYLVNGRMNEMDNTRTHDLWGHVVCSYACREAVGCGSVVGRNLNDEEGISGDRKSEK